ncbi:MAG: hypothetical protein EPO24_14780 [Bacteroidetes bacterium]|nr:MAG: hypothetical protein EPO24_14780 [Bacteroidota bacterium]
MNLREEILKEHSKRQAVKIGNWIGNNPARFKELMELFLHDEYRVTQRAAWIISYCGDNHPKLIMPWLKEMLKKTQEPGVHNAVRRNVIRVLAGIEIPKPLAGLAMGICFDELSSPKSPIAVKVHAMSVLANLSKHEPDIKGELQATIELLMKTGVPALIARGRKVLKQIAKIQNKQ